MSFSGIISPRHCLRHLDYRGEIQMFERRDDRARRAWCRCFLCKMRVQFLKLPHFTTSSPKEVAVPGVAKVVVSYTRKTAIVTFDDTKTAVPALTAATTNAGYPSTPKG